MKYEKILTEIASLPLSEKLKVQKAVNKMVGTLVEEEPASEISRSKRSFYEAFAKSTRDILDLPVLEVFRKSNKKGYASLDSVQDAMDHLFKKAMKHGPKKESVHITRQRVKFYGICFKCILQYLKRCDIQPFTNIILKQGANNLRPIVEAQFPSYISNGLIGSVIDQ